MCKYSAFWDRPPDYRSGRWVVTIPMTHVNPPEREPQPDPGKEPAAEDLPDEPGAEGGSRSPAADRPSGVPAKDDSAVGDTDQHSNAGRED